MRGWGEGGPRDFRFSWGGVGWGWVSTVDLLPGGVHLLSVGRGRVEGF